MRKIYHIYIENFFLLNMIFLFSLFKITSVYLKCSVTHIRILKGAFLGAVGMCLLLMIPFGRYMKFILGYGVLNFFLIHYIFRSRNKKRVLQIAVTVMIAAITLGGCMVASCRLIKPQNTIQTGFLTLIEAMIICKVLCWIQKEKKTQIYPVRLFLGEKTWDAKGLFDTGNSLVEPISGKPVSVMDNSIIGQVRLPETGYRVIPYRSVGMANGIMDGYIFEKMEIDGPDGKIEVKQPVIAISKQALSTTGTYRMILHPKLFVESEE